jgi:uncharacterized protein YoxC
MVNMESVRAIKENAQLAKDLAEALLPYIIQSEEYKLILETRDRLNTLIENTGRIWEAINRNSDDIRILQQEVKELHEDNKRIWEAINRNSDDIRILQQEVKELHEDNKRIWEAINRNSDDIRILHEESKKIWEVVSELTRSFQRLDVEVGSFTGRAGLHMEKTMLALYKEALRLHGIDTSKVKGAELVDQTGIVKKGRKYQVDIIEENGVTYLFEIKNYADNAALEQIAIRRSILEAEGKKVKPFIVANTIEEKVKREAEAEGVTVVAGHVVETPR